MATPMARLTAIPATGPLEPVRRSATSRHGPAQHQLADHGAAQQPGHRPTQGRGQPRRRPVPR